MSTNLALPEAASPSTLRLSADQLEPLARFLAASTRLFVLTGAGCSTESGIPDYRGPDGQWKRRQPMRYQEFIGSEAARKRYWSRSAVGWTSVAAARPNAAHEALARMEGAGGLHTLVTQNVDGLHQKAGSERVIDLHGRLDVVECLDCGLRFRRDSFQEELLRLNPGWLERAVIRQRPEIAPDGDADLEEHNLHYFRVPPCPSCTPSRGGVLKPGVVFFGENVPGERTRRAFAALEAADALLVVGSSLMVWSGYRFARKAAEQGKPIALVNLGRTRADDLASVKVEASCGQVLRQLASGSAPGAR